MSRNALIIVTSHDALGDTGKPTGFYWEELAVPYWALRDAGLRVDFASVRGGQPPADPGSDDPDDRPDAVRRFMDDAQAMRDLARSRRLAQVETADYDLVFLPGGHGTMWDFPDAATLGEAVGRAYRGGAVVGAVCHGPAGLVGATLEDGTPLVAGRRVNCFTDAEERQVGLDGVVPFLLETRLRQLGARFESNPEPFQPCAVRDGRLVTGQNPASSGAVARALLEALEAD